MEQELILVKYGKSSQETWILGKYWLVKMSHFCKKIFRNISRFEGPAQPLLGEPVFERKISALSFRENDIKK